VTVALRHVNEPVPNVLELRPEVPARLAMAVERAMAKNPDDRFESMDELVGELEVCLAELDPLSEEATMIARRPAAPRAERRRGRRRRRLGVLWPIAAVLAVLAVAGLAAFAALQLTDDGSNGPSAATNPPIRLTGIGAYDPEGTEGEHDDEAGLATDRDNATRWTTQSYSSGLNKSGVGVVVDAQRTVEPTTMTVTTDTPGFTAEIQAGDSPAGPFDTVSASRAIQSRYRFTLNDAKARYFVVWITDLGGLSAAHVNEVTAR
jgi:hypothetical protein